MSCIICGSTTNYYFSKQYKEKPIDNFMENVGTVHYNKCSNCGFVISRTHQELEKEVFLKLNYDFHSYLERESSSLGINQPPYLEQAMMIFLLIKSKIIASNNMLDYAGGHGSLSNIMKRLFNINLPIYDPYINTVNNNVNYLKKEKLSKYDIVINSAMFEHILFRSDLDELNALVSENGKLVIHTRISENIPDDPGWFYLKPPVHTAFHTNRSMSILMEQWGYKSSIYCLPARSWILIREDISEYESKLIQLNNTLNANSNWFYCTNGFVDFWKGF